MDGEKSATISASPSSFGMKTSLYTALTKRQQGYKSIYNALPVIFEAAAEDQLVSQKSYADTKCALPANTRSTFLMVFSPDGKLVASTHGDHCVYVCEVATGACVRTLAGHPRTPWCLAFHPTSSQLLASGCLGGQVRVWDLSGGSEVWCAEEQTVIASLAFHPSSDRVLVIATYNELLFWDWSKPKPFAKCSTRCDKEKIRFVTFDPLGHKLITGIANRWTPPSQWDQQSSSTFYSRPSTSSSVSAGSNAANATIANATTSLTTSAASSGSTASSSLEWTNPFNNLLQEYENLVQICRQRLGAQPERSSPSMVDRGTNTHESDSNPVSHQDTTSATQASTSTISGISRLNTFVECIASLEDHVATTNIERLRNPLAQENTVQQTSDARTSSPNTLSNLTIPCTVNLGERVSEDSLRRLREMWRAGTSSSSATPEPSSEATGSIPTSTPCASTSTRDKSSDTTKYNIPCSRHRRRRRPSSSFEPKREPKRLRSDHPRKDLNPQKNSSDSRATSSQSSAHETSENTSFSISEVHDSSLSAVGASNGRNANSIYDDPQPGTSNAREPEVILILSDSDSSSDASVIANPQPVIDTTNSARPEPDTSYRSTLELRMNIMQMLYRNQPQTPTFLQTSRQSAFTPQTPRSAATDNPPSTPPFGRPHTVPRFLRASADLGVRYAIRMLSRHIDLMERRCRARLEILQLEQIRRLWEEFMTQLSSLNSTLSSNNSRQESSAEYAAPNMRSDIWSRRDPLGTESLSLPDTSPSTVEQESRSGIQSLDREAAAAIEDAYNQISDGPPIDDEDIVMLDSSDTSNLPSTSSRFSSASGILSNLSSLSQRTSLSGQVPDDSPLDDSTRNFGRERSASNQSRNLPADDTNGASSNNLSDGVPRTSRANDNSEEYHITLLRANQISVLRRLLNLLDQTDIPLDALSSARNGAQEEQNSRISGLNFEDSDLRQRNREQSRSNSTDRNSPTEFLEELRSIQQSIVERYDHMSLEIPSQEAMQRDLDRIVNLEAAVRERLRLSEDNFERNLLDNQDGEAPRQYHRFPWLRNINARIRARRTDPLDSGLSNWGPDASNPRESQDDDLNSTTSFHSRLTQPFLFRPPPEVEDSLESQRYTPSSEEWQQNTNLLHTTRRQAWRVLGLMVRHVRQHIELHQLERFSEGSALHSHLQQLLSLLHRALELTDTLLTQMLTTRREMENQWRLRLRPTTADMSSGFRYLWHRPFRHRPSTSTGSGFSQNMAAFRERATGWYVQEMHRRGLSDTNPAIVNHLIQHFQRRIPEGNSDSIASQDQSAATDSDRSQQLRQRLGGLWSCRREPSTESHLSNPTTPDVPSTSRPNVSTAEPEPSSSNPHRVVPDESQGSEPQSIYVSIRSRYNRVCTILDRLTRLDPSPQFRSWADNLRRLLEMPQRYFEAEDERQRLERRDSTFNVPSVRVNDVPISDPSSLHQGRSQPTSPPLWTRRRATAEGPAGSSQMRSRSPSPILGRVRVGAWRSWMYYPRNRGLPTSARDLFGASHQATMEGARGGATSCPTTLTHRIQCWPFMEGNVPPDISNSQQYLVVPKCKINNDASVDVSRNGRLLVALVPSPRHGGQSKLGIYSLESSTLGQMLFVTSLDQSPVSVSLSPSSRFLLVGLAAKRFLTVRGENNPAAQVFRLPWEKQQNKNEATTSVNLEATRFIFQTSETGYVSINCIRWAPVSGQGMVYGTNTGNLGILR